MNSLFLDALACRPIPRPPVWLMRQAGRYLPSYQKLRKRFSLKTLFTEKDLIEETTLLPMDAFHPDAAILFSDITIIALSLGLDLSFQERIGPVIYPKICEEKDVIPLEGRYEPLPFLEEAIRSLKKRLDRPLIGFCGSPFTVACYFAEKTMLYRDPKGFARLLKVITECTKKHLESQVAAGVDAAQIFDSSAYLLPRHLLQEYSLPSIRELLATLRASKTPSIVFGRGSCLFIDDLIALEPTCLSFDWQESLKTLRNKVPPSMAVQGNFDPDLLYGSKERIEEEIRNHLPLKPGVIVNLGHGLKPDMDPEKVRHFVEVIKSDAKTPYVATKPICPL
ncbi:MAG: uroporphyrinogen decarboxylase family protein [Chlamydiota bacterium]